MSASIQENWRALLGRVEGACSNAGRSASAVRIVAVSKTHPAESVLEAYEAGVRLFGENYVQEALPKMDAVVRADEAEWHFIGAIQSNKAKQVIGRFSLLHSVDRWSLADALEKARIKTGRAVSVLIEVNVAEEASKSGISEKDLRPLVERISAETGIEIRGLMAFPPMTDHPETSRRYFARARTLSEEISSWRLPRIEMKELSMGVTSDFEVAIEEGATLIRIGTAIFGGR